MKYHKWDNIKSIVQTCIRCGVFRVHLKRKYGCWEYFKQNGIMSIKRVDCQIISNESLRQASCRSSVERCQ